MGALPGNHEIEELTESYDSESKISGNTGRSHLGKRLKKHAIDDDINKLFEAIDIGSSRRGIRQSDRHFGDVLCKSAMKRPMRIGPSQVSGIGISESASLKQALRGLCISQASEMAAVKKRILRQSASPGFLETGGAINKLYRSEVAEASEARQSFKEVGRDLVEISIVPESSLANVSEKAAESELISNTEVPERRGHSSVPRVDEMMQRNIMTKTRIDGNVTSLSTNIGCEHCKAELEQNSALELPENAFIPIPVEKSINTSVKQKELIKCLSGSFGLQEHNLKLRTSITKSHIQNNERSRIGEEYQSRKMVNETPDSVLEKGCSDKFVKAFSASSSKANLLANSALLEPEISKQDIVLHISSKTITASRSREKGEISQSSKSSIGEYSSSTGSYSEVSSLGGSSHSGRRPHMSKDLRRESIRYVQKQHGCLGLRHFKLLRRIGGGDIATVYLSELIGTNCLFALKVMHNETLISKKKMMRAQTEKEILEILDHPFLPTLFAHFATSKFSCLVLEYCLGGDLHVLRQKQPTKCFSEKATRFYVTEVLLALEYLHMLGVVYRDLKPENILIREDGHIMLSDFDLSLRCSVNPMLLESPSPVINPPRKASSPCSDSSCINPFCLQPSWQLSCFTTGFLSTAAKTRKLKSELATQVIPVPQLVVEPTSARSNSFVGTHEYLAPEIIKGEGHGSAVDWWTFGILLYELLYGKTPFKGSSNEETVSNVVSQCIHFPEYPHVSPPARDLIRRLLKKEPEARLGSSKGAAEIKQHPFFEGLNWALVRSEAPPEVPKFYDLGNVIPDADSQRGADEIEFEMF